MKANFLTVAALSTFICHASGYVIARADQVSEATLANAPPIVFTGPAFPGGPDVNITGTVEHIFAKLHEMNPKYDAWEFPDYQQEMARKGLTKDGPIGLGARSGNLEKRGWTKCNVDGKPVGNYITQCAEGIRYLKGLNGYCGAPKGWAGCSRVSCSHNCGIFLCNDNNHKISVKCSNIVGDFYDIVEECGNKWKDFIVSVKGAIYRDGPPKWNTLVASQSC
ncbi:hypothetical protein TWF730_008271 [Orbilia blumenaviensis]|uniref:Uncharacterized protein n=1 Tax=Orbilia blumenaviensis TaxID=1796055 RepID=A0AAV9V5Q2_9PEZI